MKDVLRLLYDQRYLSRTTAAEALQKLASGECSDAEIGAFMSVFNMRPVSAQELLGFRDAMLATAVRPELAASAAIDVCGTGGDGKDTFNVSTTAAFVIAACGQLVVKHGNYGVSSSCGSSNVLEALGVRFTADASELQDQCKRAGICFLHAPLFHPAMKHVAPARRALGVKTFFNLLGPLSNPAEPGGQISGVYSYELVRLYEQVLQELGVVYGVVHSLDGYDECSLTGTTLLASSRGTEMIMPEDLGLQSIEPHDLAAPETVQENAGLVRRILAGEGTAAQSAVVAANAGMALYIRSDTFTSLREAVAAAQETIARGAALAILDSVATGEQNT